MEINWIRDTVDAIAINFKRLTYHKVKVWKYVFSNGVCLRISQKDTGGFWLTVHDNEHDADSDSFKYLASSNHKSFELAEKYVTTLLMGICNRYDSALEAVKKGRK